MLSNDHSVIWFSPSVLHWFIYNMNWYIPFQLYLIPHIRQKIQKQLFSSCRPGRRQVIAPRAWPLVTAWERPREEERERRRGKKPVFPSATPQVSVAADPPSRRTYQIHLTTSTMGNDQSSHQPYIVRQISQDSGKDEATIQVVTSSKPSRPLLTPSTFRISTQSSRRSVLVGTWHPMTSPSSTQKWDSLLAVVLVNIDCYLGFCFWRRAGHEVKGFWGL